MLLTNWNVVGAEGTSDAVLHQTWSSFWVKLATLIMTILLYLWVLFAPKIFPDREFDF